MYICMYMCIYKYMYVCIYIYILHMYMSRYASFLREAEQQHQGKVCGRVGFTAALEHKIYAGADILLMPSRYLHPQRHSMNISIYIYIGRYIYMNTRYLHPQRH